MALTTEGRRLTESHRRAQIALAARAAVAARVLWPRLQVADLDASTPGWLAANLAVVEQYRVQSVDLSAAYISRYRAAELGSPDGPLELSPGDFAATSAALQSAGPVRTRRLIARGMSPAEARRSAFVKYAGIVRRQTLMGGRETIAATTAVDRRAIGWRRVTDGKPCTFCAMLASRGPVFTSQKAARGIAGNGLRYHGHCGCTAEIVYGSWTPTADEQRYVDAYERAAAVHSDPSSILADMRANGGFRDSPRLP